MSKTKSTMPNTPSSLLQVLPEAVLSDWIGTGTARYVKFDESALVYLAGDPCTAVDVVVEGQIAVEKMDEEGRLTRISQFGMGDVFGANLIFSGLKVFPFGVSALKPSKLLRVDPEALIKLAMADREVLLSLLMAISIKSFALSQGIDYLTGRSIEDKVLIYLRQNLQYGQIRLQLTLSKKALAEYLDISRTSLSRALKQMKSDGLIDYDRSSITLLKP
jgi:CRP/FNR family transcriptional regulator, dissimilatory nitrate respiration regulator